HDPPLRLVAEAFPARALVQRVQVAVPGRAVSEADAVVAGQVRRRLRGRDQVVAGEAVLDRAWERALLDLATQLGCELDRLLDRLRHTRLDAFHLPHLARDADAQALQVLRFRDLDRG